MEFAHSKLPEYIFFDPIGVKFLRRSLKRWCCFFPCLATRAIRIQIVLSLNVVHPDRSFTRDVELTIAALVLVSRPFFCNVSKIGETCDKTASSVIEPKNFFRGQKQSIWTKQVFWSGCFRTSEKVSSFNYWGSSLIACFACFQHIT